MLLMFSTLDGVHVRTWMIHVKLDQHQVDYRTTIKIIYTKNKKML